MRALAIVLVLGASRLAAQQTDAGVLRLYQGDREIGREVFSETDSALDMTVTIPLINAKITGRSEWSHDGRPVRVEERVYDLRTDSLLRTYTAVLDGDSMRMSLVPARGAARSWARAFRPDVIALDQSMSCYTRLLEAAPRQDKSWQVFLPNADSALEMRAAWTGDTATVTIGPSQLRMLLAADGRVHEARIPVGNVRYERYAGADNLPALGGLPRPAPDYSAPAGAPYTAEDVRVPVRPAAGDTFSLGCTLTRPALARGRVPAAITLTGSGLEDRDENLWPLVPGYHPFRQIADRLARVGIAVLRCDDRSFGASGGRADSATMLDFKTDDEAQLAWLRGRDDIAGDRLAVIGHSEGGIVGPMIAAEDRRLKALVIMAGTAKTMALVVRDQFVWPVERAQGLTDAQRAAARAAALQQAEAFLGTRTAYFRQARDYDPLPTARRVRAPVLIVQGDLDRQVSAGQADTLGAALRAGGNRDVTVRRFPRLNHLFLVSPSGTGAPDEYASLTDTAVPDDVLDTIATWLKARLR